MIAPKLASSRDDPDETYVRTTGCSANGVAHELHWQHDIDFVELQVHYMLVAPLPRLPRDSADVDSVSGSPSLASSMSASG